MSKSRLNHLINLLRDSELNALAVNPGPTLAYLTGLCFHLSERPVVLLLSPITKPTLVLPELEIGKIKTAAISIEGFTYGDNPATWQDAFARACRSVNLAGQTIGIEPEHFRYLELKYLENSLPNARFVPAGSVLVNLRVQKEPEEIEAMRKAVVIAQEALKATLPQIHIGMTEREIAAILSIEILKAGSDPEFPFSPIVASGPNSANPHAIPTDRHLQEGDMLVVDWGASYLGYCSDLTRTFAIGEVSEDFKQIAVIVEQANAAGKAEAGPEIMAGQVDTAVRKVIEQGGYGPYFIHRTGHGLGMEVHEPPYIFTENNSPLLPGMTFTVEPGIYLPDRGGVRIEDNVVITPNGCECLSDLPRGLIQIC